MMIGFLLSLSLFALIGYVAGRMHSASPSSQRRRGIPAVVAVRREVDEWEIELASGERFRSEEGIAWHRFPGGERVDVDFESWLEDQLESRRRVDKWSNTAASEER